MSFCCTLPCKQGRVTVTVWYYNYNSNSYSYSKCYSHCYCYSNSAAPGGRRREKERFFAGEFGVRGAGRFCRLGRPGQGFAAAAATYFARCGKVGKAQPGTRPMDYGCAPLRLGP